MRAWRAGQRLRRFTRGDGDAGHVPLSEGIRSSRAIETATFDDVGARVICGNLHPDHATVPGSCPGTGSG